MAKSLLFDLIVGARPNFVKVAPIFHAKRDYSFNSFRLRLVHTGQHYDYEMSKAFFDDLEIPEPDVYLEVGSGSHGFQMGKIMIEYEKLLLEDPPDLVIVFGDVNSTIATAMVATKLRLPVAHVEAGLRSFDWSMPEEINRILTDRISRYLFTTEKSGNENLLREGIEKERIHFVGNLMIDSLKMALPNTEKTGILKKLGLREGDFALLTLHRPSNVDRPENLREIVLAVKEVSRNLPVVFPVHPRTKKRLKEFGLYESLDSGIVKVEPLPYTSFLALEKNASFVLTDSGGIQEETTYLGVPCLTLRPNTERPVTVEMGTNRVIGNSREKVVKESLRILGGDRKKGKIPPLWDGKASIRILDILSKYPPEGKG